MRYQGGKSAIAKEIAGIINSSPGNTYYEPFVGGGAVLAEVNKPTRIASDISDDLILMWQAVQGGWNPPGSVSEDQYNSLKDAEPSALRGFVGYGCSWGGKWFGGYGRALKGSLSRRSLCDESRRNILKMAPAIKDVKFLKSDYSQLDIQPGSIVYCDPPYKGKTDYDAASDFNHGQFWDWVRDKSRDNVVLVSEINAPDDFEVVWKKEHTAQYGSKRTRTEKLFKLR